MDNRELLEKAVITTDALATAGKLNPVQSDRFIDYVLDQSVLKNNARIVRFRNEQMEIDKIGVGTRVAFPKTEASDPQIRRGVTTSKIVLQPREVCVPFEIGDLVKELSIEGDALEDHIVKMMATQAQNDTEELAINGDETGPAILEGDYKPGGSTTQYVLDKFLQLFDGWFRLADGGNVVDIEGSNIGLSVFNKMLRAMPTKFRRNKAALRWFMSPDLSQLYFEKLASRATALGDAAAGGQGHAPFGIPIVEVPLLDFYPPVVEHITLAASATVALRYGPVVNVVVTTNTLDSTPEDKFTEDTDYSVDYTNGTITNLDVGIGDGDTVKVTYTANPQIVLTHQSNFIYAIGREIRLERDRDIYKTVNQYNLTLRVDCEYEEDEAIVKGINIGTSV